MHLRLRSELNFRLARRAFFILGRTFPQDVDRAVFDELYRAFQEELIRYEAEAERLEARLRGVPPPTRAIPKPPQTMFD